MPVDELVDKGIVRRFLGDLDIMRMVFPQTRAGNLNEPSILFEFCNGCPLYTSLVDAYDEEQLDEKDSRVVLHLHPALAPIKAAVLPLSKKLSEEAAGLYQQLAKRFMCEFDETGSIGKRYRRQDEVGTPFCVTYDFDSQEDHCVTCLLYTSFLGYFHIGYFPSKHP